MTTDNRTNGMRMITENMSKSFHAIEVNDNRNLRYIDLSSLVEISYGSDLRFVQISGNPNLVIPASDLERLKNVSDDSLNDIDVIPKEFCDKGTYDPIDARWAITKKWTCKDYKLLNINEFGEKDRHLLSFFQDAETVTELTIVNNKVSFISLPRLKYLGNPTYVHISNNPDLKTIYLPTLIENARKKKKIGDNDVFIVENCPKLVLSDRYLLRLSGIATVTNRTYHGDDDLNPTSRSNYYNCSGGLYTPDLVEKLIFGGKVCRYYDENITIANFEGSKHFIGFFSEAITIRGRLLIENNNSPIIYFQKLKEIGGHAAENGPKIETSADSDSDTRSADRVDDPAMTSSSAMPAAETTSTTIASTTETTPQARRKRDAYSDSAVLIVRGNVGLEKLGFPALKKVLVGNDVSPKIVVLNNQGYEENLIHLGVLVNSDILHDVPIRRKKMETCPEKKPIIIDETAKPRKTIKAYQDIISSQLGYLYAIASLLVLLLLSTPFLFYWFDIRPRLRDHLVRLRDSITPLPFLSKPQTQNLLNMVKQLVEKPISIVREFTIYKPQLMDTKSWISLKLDSAFELDNSDSYYIATTDNLTKILLYTEKVYAHFCTVEAEDGLLKRLGKKRNVFPAKVVHGEDGGSDSVILTYKYKMALSPFVTARVFHRQIVSNDTVWGSEFTLLTFHHFPLNNLVPPETMAILATIVLRTDVIFLLDGFCSDLVYMLCFLRRCLQVVVTTPSDGLQLDLAQICPHLNRSMTMTCGNAYLSVSVMQFLVDYLRYNDSRLAGSVDVSLWERLVEHIAMYGQQKDAHEDSVVDLSVLKKKLTKAEILMLTKNPQEMDNKLPMLDRGKR